MVRFFILVIGISVFYSCKTSKLSIQELNYLQAVSDSSRIKVNAFEPVVEPGDILSIRINSADPKTDQLFNATGFSENNSQISSSGRQLEGYLVENDGTITLNRIGKLQVAGKNKGEVVKLLTESLQNISRDVIVTVRFVNFKITVLGEVNKQGTYTIPTEKVSILDALGLAGDLTIYGNRSNVLVIREINGIREFGKLNLNKGDIFSSEYFYLKQNDVVYVEMTNHKVRSLDQTSTRNLTLGLSALSTVAIILNVIFR